MSDPTPDTEDVPQKPTNAEDAKTLKALSNLDTHSSLDDSSTPTTSANAEALAAGLSSLSVGTGKTADAGVKKVIVKVATEDVAVIVEEMEVSKAKATELLRTHGADLKETLRAMISPSA
ncbi:uncharacterized protein DFL_004492 [Arthrobotrys flagrans]|uniref:Nascent polypeptide-associated complex subunit alpha-like UBA domain-containing protein n=1 Tax=Arthrobotrys flagrans TaxID=97331 RepID=A0A437A526_ARTFL|nr:hypothetical protein DFL_004492 [Arthrobotrys flagrans]